MIRGGMARLLWLLYFGFAATAWGGGDKEIITSKDIEREKPASLMELLRKRVGLGDAGGSLTLRGVPGVALYVDGFPESGSVTAIEKIKPQDVFSIEILRGAASSRYGADALGGALIIKTKGAKQEWSLDLIQGYDTFDSRYTRAIGSGALGETKLRLSLQDNKTNRFFNIDRDNIPFPSLYPVETSFSTNQEGNLKVEYGADSNRAGLNLNYREQKWQWGRPNYHRTDRTITPKFFWNTEFGGIKFSSNLGYEARETHLLRDRGGTEGSGLDPFLRIVADYNNLLVELKANWQDLNVGVIYGLDEEDNQQWEYDSGRKVFSLQDTVERVAGFADWSWDFWKNWQMDLSGRYDHYRYRDITVFSSGSESEQPSTVKQSFNPKAAISWQSLPWLGLRTSVATGFIPPSPSTLYFQQEQPTFRVEPNPGLQPEQSLTLDFGLEAKWEGTEAGLTLFYTRWTDKIERLTVAGTPAIQTMVNLGESESNGAELSLNTTLLDGLDLALNYTLTFTEIVKSLDPAIVGNELPYQPRHRLNAVLTYQGIPDLTARLNLHYESSQFMDIRNLERDDQGYSWVNGDYATVDCLLTRKFGWGQTGIDLTLAVNNLFNNHYAKGFFQRDPGRVIRGEIAVRF